MKRDLVGVAWFLILTVLFLWLGRDMTAFHPQRGTSVLPLEDGTVAVIYGTMPPYDASITIGSSLCLHTLMNLTYGDGVDDTHILSFVVKDGVVHAVMSYPISGSLLSHIRHRVETEGVYLIYREDKKAFDVLSIKKAREITASLVWCINKYTQEGTGADTDENHQDDIHTKSQHGKDQ